MYKNILTVVGITILFLGFGIQPAIANIQNNFTHMNSGNTLYVGGSGMGLYFEFFSINNIIGKNNFIQNKRNCVIKNSWRNDFYNNYWDDWIGVKINIPIFQRLPKIIWFLPNFRLKIDWYPAKVPYDI